MKPVRPDPALLWPAYTLFPLAAVLVLFFGAAGHDPALTAIGVGLLALNGGLVVDRLYFTSIAIEGDELVHRSWFGLREERIPVGSIQRVDAKRYAGGHGGVSAPHFVVRGRASTLRANTKAYRLRDLAALIGTLRAANPRLEVDDFWARVEGGEDVSKEAAVTPKARF